MSLKIVASSRVILSRRTLNWNTGPIWPCIGIWSGPQKVWFGRRFRLRTLRALLLTFLLPWRVTGRSFIFEDLRNLKLARKWQWLNGSFSGHRWHVFFRTFVWVMFYFFGVRTRIVPLYFLWRNKDGIYTARVCQVGSNTLLSSLISNHRDSKFIDNENFRQLAYIKFWILLLIYNCCHHLGKPTWSWNYFFGREQSVTLPGRYLFSNLNWTRV